MCIKLLHEISISVLRKTAIMFNNGLLIKEFKTINRDILVLESLNTEIEKINTCAKKRVIINGLRP